jgi:hypothetical protein
MSRRLQAWVTLRLDGSVPADTQIYVFNSLFGSLHRKATLKQALMHMLFAYAVANKFDAQAVPPMNIQAVRVTDTLFLYNEENNRDILRSEVKSGLQYNKNNNGDPLIIEQTAQDDQDEALLMACLAICLFDADEAWQFMYSDRVTCLIENTDLLRRLTFDISQLSMSLKRQLIHCLSERQLLASDLTRWS